MSLEVVGEEPDELQVRCQKLVPIAKYLTEFGDLTPGYDHHSRGSQSLILKDKDGTKYSIFRDLDGYYSIKDYAIHKDKPGEKAVWITFDIEIDDDKNETITGLNFVDFNAEDGVDNVKIDFANHDLSLDIDPRVLEFIADLEKVIPPVAQRFSEDVAKGLKGGRIDQLGGLFPKQGVEEINSEDVN